MPAADLVIRDARVYTVDDATPWAGAVAIDGERIAWVGEDPSEHVGSSTQVIEAKGRLVLPGFIDSHIHVRPGSNPLAVHLNDATTLEEIRARVARHAEAHPELEWIEGEGWNYTAMPGGRSPRAEDLEGLTAGRPAFLFSYDYHTVWMNRAAMERFGIGAGETRLPFGTMVLDEGRPTGFVKDFAVMGLSRDGQRALSEFVPSYSPGSRYRRLVDSVDQAARLGITTVVEPQNSLDDLELFQKARVDGALRSRIIAALFHPHGTTSDELDAFQEAKRTYDDDRFRVAPIKLYIDDVVEPRTAAMLEPYVGGGPDDRGDTFWEPGAFAELIAELDRRGFQTFTHAIGDRGIRTALDAIEHAQRLNGRRDARHQLVHVECLSPQDVPRFGGLGVVPCMQPRHCAPDIVGEWRANVGPERSGLAWAFRSLVEAGAPLAFSSDWNVAEMDPLIGIYTALTRASLDGRDRWVPEQTVDLETAIRAYTIGGAWANHAEADRGSITAGKYADLIVLSHDLFALPPEGILEARVEVTIIGGRVVHRDA
jgi:hypothetical protein